MARTKRTLPSNNRGAAYRILRASQAHLRATATAAAIIRNRIIGIVYNGILYEIT
jgi:hypothetical protein